MQHPLIETEIRYKGGVILMTPPRIAQMLRDGLTADDYTALALTADEHRMTIEALMAAALEGEAMQ